MGKENIRTVSQKSYNNIPGYNRSSFVEFVETDYFDPGISKYFSNMVEETVNYRERNNITRNDFMHLLIQIKNKFKLEEDNESLLQNALGTLERSSSAEGMYTVSYCT